MAKRSSKKKEVATTAVPAVKDKSSEVLERATGTKMPHLQEHLIGQLSEALWTPSGLSDEAIIDQRISAISLLHGIKPIDTTESMLAVQMVATHSAAMECLRLSMREMQTFESRDQSLKHAAKLLSIYSRQVEVLDKHRGKGQQKVTVEHVHVEAGGQAMVGHIETGKTEATRGAGAEPETKATTNDPGETIDADLEVKKSAPSRKS